jgi:hypothetical protein
MCRRIVLLLALFVISSPMLAAKVPTKSSKLRHKLVPLAAIVIPVIEQAKADVRGTTDQPLVIASQEDPQKKIDDHDLSIWTGWLCFFTAVLAVIAACQVWLFWKQLSQMRVDSENTRATASAAQKTAEVAEQSIRQLEQPYVFGALDPETYKKGKVRDGGFFIDLGQPSVIVYNFGRTPALLTHIYHRVEVLTGDNMPDPVDSRKIAGKALPVGSACANGDPFGDSASLLDIVMDDQQVLKGQQRIWLVGFVRYTDVFGSAHISGFTQMWDPSKGRFVRRGDKSYNYSGLEIEAEIPQEEVPV